MPGSDALLVGGLTFASIVALGLGLRAPLTRWLQARAERQRARAPRLTNDDLPWGLIHAGPVLALVVFALAAFAGTWFLGLVLAFLLVRLVDWVPGWADQRRLKRLEEQLPDALGVMANSLRAGLSPPQAIAQVAETMRDPIGEEFERVSKDYGRGSGILDAMEQVRTRIGSRSFDLMVAAFRVGRQQGGNLALVFDRIEHSIREIRKVEEEIRTATTKGRQTARIMTVMPIVFFLMLLGIDPDATWILFENPIGNVILGIVILINVLCHLWIRRMIAVEV